MTQTPNPLMRVVQAIEEKGHSAAVFLRGNTNFMIASAAYDPDLPGLWVCQGTQGHVITIEEASITAVVEHKQQPQ